MIILMLMWTYMYNFLAKIGMGAELISYIIIKLNRILGKLQIHSFFLELCCAFLGKFIKTSIQLKTNRFWVFLHEERLNITKITARTY